MSAYRSAPLVEPPRKTWWDVEVEAACDERATAGYPRQRRLRFVDGVDKVFFPIFLTFAVAPLATFLFAWWMPLVYLWSTLDAARMAYVCRPRWS